MEAVGIHVMRIPDKLYVVGRRICSEETPADYAAWYPTDYALECMLVEAKACSRNRLPFSSLQPHRRDALRAFEGLHGNAHGFVAVNFYDQVSLSRMDICFMIPIQV